MLRLSVLILLVFLAGCSTEETPEQLYSPPSFSGIAYVLPREADHIGVLSLSDGQLNMLSHNTDASYIVLSKDGKFLYVLDSEGKIHYLDLTTGQITISEKIGKSLFAAEYFSDGTLWITDPGGAALIIYEPEQKKVLKKTPIPEAPYGITFSQDFKVAYLVDTKAQKVDVLDTTTMEITGTINNIGNSVHLARLAPYGNQLWIAEGNEYKDGKPYGVGYAKTAAMPGGINVLDLTARGLEDFIYVGGNTVDLRFSPEGDFAFVISSQMPEYDEASLTVIDVQMRRMVKNYALCKPCHVKEGVTIKNGKALVLSLAVDLK